MELTIERRHLAIGAVSLALLVGAGWVIFGRDNSVARWKSYPTSKEEAVRQLFEHIATDDNGKFDDAYRALIDLEIKQNVDTDQQRGVFRQVFHEVDKYLKGEFGSDWITKMNVRESAANPDAVEVRVERERLNVLVRNQVPAGKTGETPRWGVVDIAEFPRAEGGALQQSAAVGGMLRGVAGEGAERNLNAITAAGANMARETKMQTKRRVLPILRDPSSPAIKRVILQSWVVRNDPVIRYRLEQIVADEVRYNPELRATAKAVLTGSVPEEDLVAAGVTNTW